MNCLRRFVNFFYLLLKDSFLLNCASLRGYIALNIFNKKTQALKFYTSFFASFLLSATLSGQAYTLDKAVIAENVLLTGSLDYINEKYNFVEGERIYAWIKLTSVSAQYQIIFDWYSPDSALDWTFTTPSTAAFSSPSSNVWHSWYTATLADCQTGQWTVYYRIKNVATSQITTIASKSFSLTCNCPVISTSSTSKSCGNNNGKINVSWTQSRSPYRINYTGTATGTISSISATSQTLTGMAAGNYNITLTDANNCAVTTTAVVNSDNSCRCTDSLELIKLYNATNGTNWTNKWNLSQPMTTWYGIKLNANGCVECIDMDGNSDCGTSAGSGNNLVGTLPNLNMANLNMLNFNYNRLTGVIPNFNLPNLQWLLLYSNQLNGTIPNFNLPNLQYLWIHNNQITGSIPNFNLPKLMDMRLESNQLTGIIPNFNLPNLITLNLNNNKLSGSVPNFSSPNLSQILLSYNQLSGVIPTLNLPQLRIFIVDNNKITKVNRFFSSKLIGLNLNNNLIDSLPDFSNITTWDSIIPVQNLKTGYNKLTFKDVLFNIGIFGNYTNSQYTPQDSIFKDTTYQTNTGANLTIDLAIDGAITDNSYKWFKNGTLYRTTTTNKLPLSNLQLTDAGVYTCQVTNPRAPLLTLYSRKATVLVQSSCRTNDSLELMKLYNATGGPNWTNKWDTTKPIDTWYGVYIDVNGCVTQLSLNTNNLIGILPNINIPNLQVLALSSNQLMGNIPNFNLSNLVNLALSRNQFSGSIPNFNMPNLSQLLLSNNQLTGNIPNFNLPKLVTLYVNGNKLTGNIPNFSLPNLFQLWLNNNQFSGSIPNFNLPKLEILNLYQNQINGCPTLTNLPSLKKDSLTSQRGFRAYNNKLTFKDILPNIGLATTATFIYSPQDTIFQNTIYRVTEGANLTIDLGIDVSISSNIYKWYKDGIFYRTVNGSNKLTFLPALFTDAGDYTCVVTNPNVPLLTLQSRKATVVTKRACQPFTTMIESSTPAIQPADTSYINACMDTRVTLKAKSIYPLNRRTYTQSDTSLSTYSWYFGDGTPVTYGTEVTHVFKKSGGFFVQLTVTDTVGCINSNTLSQRVRIASRPNTKIGLLPTNLCPNSDFTLNAISTRIDSAYSLSFKASTDSFPFGQSGGGSIFIPDDPAQEFSTSLFFFSFRNGQTLTNISDLKRIYLNMEHSYARDLEIKVVCPSGRFTILHGYDFATRNRNRILLGTPLYSGNDCVTPVSCINDPLRNPPGTGAEYSWQPNGVSNTLLSSFTASGTFTLPSGSYASDIRLNALIGCPLNGEWKIVVKDQFGGDNGYIFQWGIEFDKNLYANANIETFTPSIAEHKWLNNPNILQNFGDSIRIRTPNADSAVFTYQIKNSFGCTFDTSVVVLITNNKRTTSKDVMICNGTSYLLSSGRVVNVAGIYLDTVRNTRNCDSLITKIDLTIAPPPTTTTQTPVLCNGQFYTLPNGQTVSSAINYRDTLRNQNGCDSLIRVVTVTTGSNPTTSNLNPSICRGQNYTLPNRQIVSPLVTTTYSDTLKSRSGCDSLIRKTVVNVGVPIVLPALNAIICRGQSYTLPSGLRISPIITTAFGDTVRSRNGCDSLIRSINITVNQPTTRTVPISICSGQNYRLSNGKIVTVSGVYQDTLRSIIGCDSLITTTTLTINSKVDSTKQTPVLCSGQSYTLPNGQTVSSATNYRDTARNQNGCDSLIRIVTVTTGSNPTTSNLNASICRGQNYTLPSGQIVSPLVTTTYSDTLKSRSGCDSLIRKTVVNVGVPTVLLALNTTICRGQSYTLPSGRVVSPIMTTTLSDTVRGRSGCDSLIRIVNVTISSPPTVNTLNPSICFGKSYTLPNGQIVTPSVNTTYRDTLKNQNGCDSLMRITNVNISFPTRLPPQNVTICRGQSYTLPSGRVVSPIITTTLSDTARSSNGCDSLIRIVNVTISSPATVSTLNPSICFGKSYTLPNGQIVTPSVNTTYRDTLPNLYGCDSLIRVTTVNVSIPTLLPPQNATICRGKSYTLPSGRLVSPIITTAFGDTVRSRSGCDSLIRSINITVNQPTARPLSNSICSGQNYTLPNGKIVTASGVYQDTLRSVIGCDSIITTTTLTVTPPTETPLPVTICSGQTHRLQNGKIVSIAGVYRDTLKNAQGCNTVFVTTLTVNFITTPRNKSIFEGQFDTLPKGRIVNTEGVYRDSFKTKNGCDSVVITTLTVRKVVIDETCFEELKKTLPDAFSPNDDGVNDIFDPEKYFIPSGCPASLHAEQLVIVSKWGEVIYQAKPYQAWDGTSNGYKRPVATGAYYYVLVFKVNDKEKLVRGVINCFSR